MVVVARKMGDRVKGVWTLMMMSNLEMQNVPCSGGVFVSDSVNLGNDSMMLLISV